ncbi:MAG: transglutaminase domain-containing protein [Bacteroidaceae bacterium]|nr:transglutaminase domain-containing protein [Bacteroidaceae bacterium]
MFCPFSACAQTAPHFISDAAYRAKAMKAYQEKETIIGNQYTQGIDLLTDAEEAEALRFLFAYMPLADITDYPLDFHLQNVRSSFRARAEMPWGQTVPELLFRHFVLPVRVNNEALDTSRVVFFRELKERVRGLSMQEAILEVNHWCHERVTYAPSDGRTLSPLACIRNALGRCGEESTFTVSALRSIGIPARQVYTPRWAHTDDNHAWVEAWADGQWYFLGACEPEPVLNLGWFNAPASRAMLMHTRAFGDYQGPEEVMLRTSCFTEINLINNYGSSARIDFRVTDEKGRPVSDARVDFKIYNYAEFCTVATKYTGRDGRTFLTAGKGDMLVWASKNGRFGYARASFGRERKVHIVLAFREADAISSAEVAMDIVPPAERVLIPEVPVEQRQANQRRLAYEDSLRRAYEATFMSERMARQYSPRFASFLTTSRGNWATLLTFIEKNRAQEDRVFRLLSSLSDKDLRDMPLDILEDNLTASGEQLCPRVENEMILHPFKHYLCREFLSQASAVQGGDTAAVLSAYRKDPSLLVQWVREHIRLNPDTRALRIAQTPVGVWQSRLTDSRSRDIFFVDLARSLGIEARKDVVTGKVQYKVPLNPLVAEVSSTAETLPLMENPGDAWVDVNFEAAEQVTSPQGLLVLTYEPTRSIDNPKYYSHFTLSRIMPDGYTRLLNFEEGQVDMGGGTSWATTFRDGARLDVGTYLLTTGTRLANGSVLATNRLFAIREGETTTLPLVLRQTDTEVSVIGSFDSESVYLPLGAASGREVSILSQTGRGYFVVGLVGMGQEPTNHALRDIAKMATAFNQWGRPLLLLFESEGEAAKFRAEDYGILPQHLLLGIDRDGSIRRQVAMQMKLSGQGQLPIFIIADTFNRVVFCSEGYTIGLGEQMQWVTGKLQ